MKLFSLGDVKLPGSNNAKKKTKKKTKKKNEVITGAGVN